MRSILNISAVLGDVSELQLHPKEMEDVLTVAYLAMCADGHLSEEKVDTFERAVQGLLGAQGTALRATLLMTRLGRLSELRGPAALLLEAAHRLKSTAARQAYKLAYAMLLSSVDTNDQEFLFEDRLREALGLSEQDAEQLMDEVVEAVESRDSDTELD